MAGNGHEHGHELRFKARPLIFGSASIQTFKQNSGLG